MKKILLACLSCLCLVVGCGGANKGVKDETYDISVKNTGKKYATANDFYDNYSKLIANSETEFQNCITQLGSDPSKVDVSKLNECKKAMAEKLQELVDTQGPANKASQEKALDDLMMKYNNEVVQGLKHKMSVSESDEMLDKISDIQQKMTVALLDYSIH